MRKNKNDVIQILIITLFMIFLTALFLTKYSIRTKELVELNNDFESYKELQASQYEQLKNEYNLVITEYEKIYQENKRLSETNTTLEKLIKMQSDKLVNHKGNGCEPIVEKIETVTVSSSIIDEPYTEENNVPQEQPQIEDNSSEDTPTNEGMTFVGYYELTAYTHTGNPMANGQMPFVGACACNSLPLGTVVYIEGYGTFTVCDTGGMGGGVIDIFMDTYDECIQFGRQGGNVYIVN